jgi:hypothetical protein
VLAGLIYPARSCCSTIAPGLSTSSPPAPNFSTGEQEPEECRQQQSITGAGGDVARWNHRLAVFVTLVSVAGGWTTSRSWDRELSCRSRVRLGSASGS